VELLDAASSLAKVLADFQTFRSDPNEQNWSTLRAAYDLLDPALKSGIDQAIQQDSPGLPPLSELLSIDPYPQWLTPTILGNVKGELDKLGAATGLRPGNLSPAQYAELASILSQPEMYSRALVRFGRHLVLERMAEKPVDLLGMPVQMTAPMVLAAAHAYGLGLEPPPALTEGEARNGLDPYILQKLASVSPSCAGAASEADLTNCLLGLLPNGNGAALQKSLGPQAAAWLKQGIAAESNLIRTEINRTLLLVFVGKDAFDEMTVDRGVRPGELNKRWLMGSLKRLDGQDEARRAVLDRAADEVRTDMKVRVADLRRYLSAQGQDWLERLKRTPGPDVAVPDADWAPLLAHYGDEAPRFIEKARAALPDGDGLRVEFNPVSEFGVVTQRKDGIVTVKLPPVAGPAGPGPALDSALSHLPR
jgi:hypothetical protein